MKGGGRGFSSLEVMPALLLLAVGLSLSARMLWGSWRAEAILNQEIRREEAYAAARETWMYSNGRTALVRHPGFLEPWEVLEFPGTDWLPETIGLPPDDGQFLFRRREEKQADGLSFWVVEWRNPSDGTWALHRTCLADSMPSGNAGNGGS